MEWVSNIDDYAQMTCYYIYIFIVFTNNNIIILQFILMQPDMNHCNLNITLNYKKQQETLHIVVHEANNLNLPHG